MAKYITEVFKEINDDIGLFQSTYKKEGSGGPLAVIFYHAFTKSGKFVLPEGEPPYKESTEPIGMTPASFINEVKKFNIYQRTDISNTKREMIFVQTLEALHPTEAKILIAIKDQNLTSLYPNITGKVVADAGFIDVNDLVEQPKN